MSHRKCDDCGGAGGVPSHCCHGDDEMCRRMCPQPEPCEAYGGTGSVADAPALVVGSAGGMPGAMLDIAGKMAAAGQTATYVPIEPGMWLTPGKIRIIMGGTRKGSAR